MSDLDLLPFGGPTTEPNLGAPKPRRCRRHEWAVYTQLGPDAKPFCLRCGAIRNEARAKVGKAVVQRSKREERSLAKRYNGVRTGHHGGPDDVQTSLLNVQSKVSPSWFVERYWLELVKLPRTGGRVPMLVVSDGGKGRHVRRMVILDERDWRDLHGTLGTEP